MTDWPPQSIQFPVGAAITPDHVCCATCNAATIQVVNYAAAAAPAANRAIYIPFDIDLPVTAKQMFWENGGVAGTTDVGIYDSNNVRLVSSGATTNSGSIQVVNITDTLLVPGSYFMAWLPSTVTTETYWSAAVAVATLRACGVMQQAVGSATLPNPMTPTVVASAYLPMVGIAFQATM